MRNMSSPLESVAPMMRSGSSPLAKPLGFSALNRTTERFGVHTKLSEYEEVFIMHSCLIKKKIVYSVLPYECGGAFGQDKII